MPELRSNGSGRARSLVSGGSGPAAVIAAPAS